MHSAQGGARQRQRTLAQPGDVERRDGGGTETEGTSPLQRMWHKLERRADAQRVVCGNACMAGRQDSPQLLHAVATKPTLPAAPGTCVFFSSTMLSCTILRAVARWLAEPMIHLRQAGPQMAARYPATAGMPTLLPAAGNSTAAALTLSCKPCH